MERTINIKSEDIQKISEINGLLIACLGEYLDKHELAILLKHSHISTFTTGDSILIHGKIIKGLYLILDGVVHHSAQTMLEKATNLETLNHGHFLNSTGFLENCPCPTSFIANSTVLCLFIPDSYFKLLFVEYPETNYKLFKLIARQICTRIKSIHGIVISFISDLDMTSLSFFDRMVYSLKQPKKIVLEEREINKELFKQSPVFESFSKDEVDILFNSFIILDAPKHCKLLTEGEKTPSCFVVIYGAIQTCIMQNNKLAKLSVIGPGTLLATIGCVDNASSFNMTYITCEHSILCKLSESELQSIKTDQPELWYKLFRLICGSLAALKKSIDKLDIRLHTETYNR